MYRATVRGFSLVFVGLGVAVVAVTLANGGGPVSVGVLMGLAFVAVGVFLLWVASRMQK